MTPKEQEEMANAMIEALQKENNEELVFENDKAKWFSNSWTRSATDWAHKKCGLKEIVVLIAEHKEEGEKSYIILERRENEMSPIYENTNYEAVCYHLDAMSVARGTRKK